MRVAFVTNAERVGISLFVTKSTALEARPLLQLPLTDRKARPAKAGAGSARTGERSVFKLTHCVIAAAAIAGIITVLTGISVRLDADPLAEPAQTQLKTCTKRPWPYLNCVGTPFGNPHIRLVTTDRLPQ